MASDRRDALPPLDDVDESEHVVLSDLLNKVFDKGVVITGSVTIGIADIDLVRVSLDLVLSSAEGDMQRRRGRLDQGEPSGDPPVLPSGRAG
ncbi:MAG TPA: gas vesicle protein [Gemmatimonadaceae bacterium]|nr:gas vesicle protein [Gemmatimonadaceae bacterium]